MSKEIERKFLVKEMPDLTGLKSVVLERHFLFNEQGVELRIQSNGEICTLQRKTSLSRTVRDTNTLTISKAEFDLLKQVSKMCITRESYHLADMPKTDLRIYYEQFEGLIRAEFEFDSEEEGDRFVAPDWVGAEITHTPLARDSQLLLLSQEDFHKELQNIT